MHTWKLLLIFLVLMAVTCLVLCAIRIKAFYRRTPTPDELKRIKKYWQAHDAPADTNQTSPLPRMVFVGLARDIRWAIGHNMDNLIELGEKCIDYRIVIVENDSSDGTDIVLQEYAKRNAKIKILSFKDGTSTAIAAGSHNLKRFATMAYWRNKYLDELRNPEYRDFEYVCIADMDHTGTTTARALHTCFEQSDWDMVSCNGLGNSRNFDISWIARIAMEFDIYYDPLALRIGDERIRNHSPIVKGTLNKVNFDRHETKWTPVTSAFCGMTIYRKEPLLQCKYDGYDCEHVALHDDMIKKGSKRMFVNPRFVLRH